MVRRCEEIFDAPVDVGHKLIYRSKSRFPWINLIFDLEPGTVCEVLSVEYDPAVGGPDYDPEDNHYHYKVRGLEEHGTINTTEVVSMFDLQGIPGAFASICDQIEQFIQPVANRGIAKKADVLPRPTDC
jgi:hypothetical protein